MRYKNLYLINTLKYIIIAIPIIIYFVHIYLYALNLPCMDDFDAILGYLIRFKNARGLDKFYMLFEQHNEHRILSSRIIYVLYKHVFGEINFRGLILIGNLQLSVAFAIVVYFIRKFIPKYWFAPVLITSMCVFDLSNWGVLEHAMGSNQNFGVFFLFTTSLFFYSLSNKRYLIPAVLFQIVCIYSSGNGMVAAAFIVLYTLLIKDRPKLITAGLVFVVFVPLYFLHYSSPSTGHPSDSIAKMLIYFLRFSGAHVFYNSENLTIIAGIITLIIFKHSLPVSKRLFVGKEAAPIVCLSGFLLCSMAVASAFRCELGGEIASRYLVYPHILVAVSFIFLLNFYKGKKYTTILSIFLVMILMLAYNVNFWEGRSNILRVNGEMSAAKYYYPNETGIQPTVEAACDLNIYCIENHRTAKK